MGTRTSSTHSALPAALLTFSLLLIIFAVGFVIGRVVVARAYLSSAPHFEAPASEPARDSVAAAPPGRVFVPTPSSSSRDADRRPDARSDESAGDRQEEADRREPEAVAPSTEAPSEPEPGERPRPAAEPEPPPGPEAPQPSADSGTTYSIQVGVFTGLPGARQMVDELARAGYPARIAPEQRGSQELYRVVTGRYRSEYAARKALEQLRSEGFDAFLLQQ